MTANRRIFLNIIATYGRSLYALVIGLFTARWALQALGQTDYGLYGVVGGLTVLISYLNGILGGSIGRFYAVSVGAQQKDREKGLETCRMWFTTAVVLNTIMPTVLMMIGYPTGLWAVQHFLTIPADRVADCIWVWRFVCITCFLGMVTIPFSAMYTAKQYIAELTIYSFTTTTAHALVLYYMVNHPGVWLAKYACAQCAVAFLPQVIIATRAYFIFPECRVIAKYLSCWRQVCELSNYALWNAWGTLGTIFRAQGNAILINKYFGPQTNAGFTIGSTLSAHTNTLSGSMTGAFSPAIFNAWGAGNYSQARDLALRVCKIGTLFVLIFAIPLILEVDEVLLLWLKEPPQFAAGFCVFVLIMNIIDKLALGHVLLVNANGKIARYQAFIGTIIVLTLPIAWGLVELGVGPYAIGWAMVSTMILCALGRVWFARTLVNMSSVLWLKGAVLPVLISVFVSLSVGMIPQMFLSPSFVRIVLTTLAVEVALLPLSWFVIMNASERDFVSSRVGQLFRRRDGSK